MKLIKHLIITSIVILTFVLGTMVVCADEHTVTDGNTFDLNTASDGDTISVAAGAMVTISHSVGTSKQVQIVCGEGVNLTLDGVNIDGADTHNFCALSFTRTGSALTITNENTLKSGLNQPGIKVVDGTELTIGGDGTLNSYGGNSGAGIGAGENANCGNINITGGNINAAGGEGGAGIGGGFSYYGSNCGRINISGGTVTAIGNYIAAGIGGGDAYFSGGNGGTVTISNGAKVYASKGSYRGKDIGAGSGTNQGSLEISDNATLVFTRSNEAFSGTNNYSENDFTFDTDNETIMNNQGSLFPDKTLGGVYFYTTLDSIVVAAEPTKTTYNEGESLDLSGLVVTLTYPDSSTEQVNFTDFEAKEITTNPTNGTTMETALHDGNPVTIACSRRTATTGNLTVASVVVNSIAVATEPTKTTYNEGESLDLSGLVATLTYSDSSTEQVNFTDFEAKGITTNPTNGTAMETALHDGNPVTITCSGQTATTSNLTVTSVVVTGIAVAAEPTKITYDEGDSLDLSGLVVTLTYSDSSSEQVNFTNFEAKGITTNPTNGTALNYSHTPITISCNGVNTTQGLTIGNMITDGDTFDLNTASNGDTISVAAGATVTIRHSGGASKQVQILCGEGVNLILDGVNIDGADTHNFCALSFTGTGNTLTITNENTLKSGLNKPGIKVVDGTELTIGGDGTLNSRGGDSGAGIGAGENANCGNINITGGNINAAGGEGGAGIGGGFSYYGSNCGRINISGGTVTAIGNYIAAGIGGGDAYFSGGNGGTVAISNDAKVYAAKGSYRGKDIGAGSGTNQGSLTISGNETVVFLANDLVGPSPTLSTPELGHYIKNDVVNKAKALGLGERWINSEGGYFIPILLNIKYDGNGNTGGTVPIDNSNNLSGTEVIVYGNTGTLTRTGYTFNGWNTEADGGGTPYSIGTVLNITEDTTLYAQWIVNNYNVTFNTNGGSAVNNIVNVVYKSTINEPSQPTKDGYTFMGWYKDNNIWHEPWLFDTHTVTNNVTLYAKWEEAVSIHTIRAIAGNGGSIAPNGDVKVTEGVDQTFNISANSGYRINDVVVTMEGGTTVSVGAVSQYTFNHITTDGEINVTFARKGSNLDSPDREKTPTMKVKEAIEEAMPNSNGVKKVRAIIDTDDKGKASLMLPSNFVTDDSTVELTVQTDGVSITFSSHMFTRDEESIEISIEPVDVNDLNLSDEEKEMLEKMPTFDVSISTGDKDKGLESSKGIKISFTVDNSVQGDKLVAVHIDENGNIEILKQSMLNNGIMSFNANYLSKYGVIYIDKSFDDTQNHWSKEAVEALAAREITMGTSETTFDPNGEITRADFITLLARCFEFESDLTNSFIDVETDKYYSNPIATAKSLGILDTVKGEFKPLEAITITDIMVYLEKSIKAAEIKFETTNKSAKTYSDFALVDDYAKESVEYLISTGLFQSTNNMVNPMNTKTRAEIVQMLYNMLVMMF